MKKTFFTVGPTKVHPRMGEFIKDALENNILSLSHRGKGFQDLYEATTASLRKVLRIGEDRRIFFLGSATEAMERIIENCVERTSLHFVNGAFSDRFFLTAKELGKDAQKMEVAEGRGFDLSQPAPDAEVVCFTQNETGTGVQTPMEDIYGFKRRFPDAILALDIVSSTPYVEVDFSMVDCAFFSVQKGFGMPAGLGVFIVNEKCLQKARFLKEKGQNIGTFHSFPAMDAFAARSETPETPNVLSIYLLGRICDAYREYDIDRIRRDTDEKAKKMYEFFEGSSVGTPFVKDARVRSRTTLTIEISGGSKVLREKLAEKGLVLDGGYGKYKESQLRIANFPSHTMEDVEGLLAAIQ